MTTPEDDLIGTIAGIRRCFWLLGVVSDEMVADLGLTASLRAVLEHLNVFGDATVPQIAAEKAVKRQSIQALVDQLREQGLVSVRENPAHRRSVLITLTPAGRSAFREVQKREQARLKALRHQLDPTALAQTARTLSHMRDELRRMVEGEINDDD
jgi:DNA-binding MarR family transcriptional regulator